MTKRTTRKTAAKKTAPEPKAPEPKAPEPMDPDAREGTAAPRTNNQRPCWAIKTLVAEVHSLFPETPVEFSNYNGRNTALDVSFDLTTLDNDDAISLIEALALTQNDERVVGVVSEDGALLVSMRANPRTQDSREPFGVVQAYGILTDEPFEEPTPREDDEVVEPAEGDQ